MEGGALDRRSGDQHWLQFCNRRDGACATHLVRHCIERGRLLLRFKFVRNGPPGAFGRHAQFRLLAVRVDLDDDSIDGKWKRVTGGIPMRDEVQNAFNRGRNLDHALCRRWRREPPRLGLLNGRHVAFDGGIRFDHAV